MNHEAAQLLSIEIADQYHVEKGTVYRFDLLFDSATPQILIKFEDKSEYICSRLPLIRGEGGASKYIEFLKERADWHRFKDQLSIYNIINNIDLINL
jgi:hypothetical protein